MYSKGVSYNDICTHLEDLYGLTVSPGTLSAITNRVIEDIKQWQSRPLETVYPFLWLDAIHYKVREDHAIKTKAVYCVLGVSREGIKDLLGLYISENEGARFWLSVLSDLQSRGVKDILIACIDNLKGFAEAIESIFPQTEVQLCIVHQLRNSFRYVPWKERKPLMQSLKSIYQAPNKDIAERALNELDLLWGEKYPAMVKSWLNNWSRLSNYFKYPSEIRRVIYTTNIIESFHSQLRKITKSKRVFSSDMSLIKLLFMVYTNLKRGWSGGFVGWKLTMSQLMIIFEDRLSIP
jgi:putative transposase